MSAYLFLLCFLVAGCPRSSQVSRPATVEEPIEKQIVGTWIAATKDGSTVSITYNADGTGYAKISFLSGPFHWKKDAENQIEWWDDTSPKTITRLKMVFDNGKMTQISSDGSRVELVRAPKPADAP